MNYITFGRFTLPADLLAAFAAIFIAALVYRLKEKKSIDDWYWNSFFIYIAIYKLSYALFNFKMFIDTPLSLLYFNGGTKGQILAFAGIALYLLWIARKKGSSINTAEYLPVYFIFFMLYWTALFALSEDLLAAALQALFLLGFLVFYFSKTKLNLQYAILFLMLEVLILSLFSDLFSLENLLILALGFYLLTFLRSNKEEVQL
ncbi:hypothetical protein M3204_06640 [Mesobacillus subterraneus]|uniref:hypothetical protein n=1 Tax=Mesobacillus subterraneus TaxID=285983 RepID=UPI00204205E3|nr:hypothetical protein [Mesobacillus subterraneus]MCM3664072.1 hypothetical protein [Mesobacillus subterraneus]MCM3685564.1 hypothetical protein [Mesobacillus subterraneus]